VALLGERALQVGSVDPPVLEQDFTDPHRTGRIL
jgi:hypothetical protein